MIVIVIDMKEEILEAEVLIERKDETQVGHLKDPKIEINHPINEDLIGHHHQKVYIKHLI